VKCVNQCPPCVDRRTIYRKRLANGNLSTISGDSNCSRKRIVPTRKNWLDILPSSKLRA
jgi:hypothetical protein